MSQEFLGGIAGLVVLAILIMIYVIRRAARAGKAALADPEIRAWMDKEEALNRYGEWRAVPGAGLILAHGHAERVAQKYIAGQADLILLPQSQVRAPFDLAPLIDYVDLELNWQLQYQSLAGSQRSDLRPAGDGPTLAIMELHETFRAGAVAQVGRQGYLIYSPAQPGQAVERLPELVTMQGKEVTLADGRVFLWQPAQTIYDQRAFTDQAGAVMITFHHLNVRVKPAAPADAVPILILLEYFMYTSPILDEGILL